MKPKIASPSTATFASRGDHASFRQNFEMFLSNCERKGCAVSDIVISHEPISLAQCSVLSPSDLLWNTIHGFK